MLPSDLDEVIDAKQGINKSIIDIKKRKKECEEQYESWKQGLLKHLKPPKDETKVEKSYVFYSLNGLYTNGQHPKAFPNDLAPFVSNPFDKWHEPRFENIDKFGVFFTKNKYHDSQFWPFGAFTNNHLDYYTELEYKGPKWLIEEDKDFFMNEVSCKSNVRNKETGNLESKIYYLHFNPVKNYITLYTQKFNTQEIKK